MGIENRELRVAIAFEPREPDEWSLLFARLRDMGGKVVDLSAYDRPLENENPLFVAKSEFDAYAALRGVTQNWITRSWSDSVRLSNFFRDEDALEDSRQINLANTLKYMRIVESGALEPYRCGGTAWNVLTDLTNARLGAIDGTFVLPWDREVHPGLWVKSRLNESAEILRQRYNERATQMANSSPDTL